jgi:two-component system sensor histidine kinase/response regulator
LPARFSEIPLHPSGDPPCSPKTLVSAQFAAVSRRSTEENRIIGLLELALPRCSDATLRNYLEKAAHAGKHLSRIINDLLDLSKVVAGRIELEAIPFSLNELLQRVRDVVAHKAEAKGLHLRLHADREIPDVLVGDPTRVEQVLLNLAGNAIKFTSAGKVDVHVALVARSEDQVRLSIDVSDSGIGMTPEEISGLFRPFSQANAATSRSYGGTGLGLALSQRLAEAMGGRITVSSRKGHGSVFSLGLCLPLAGGPQVEPELAAAPANYDQARVLLVEDDAVNAEIVTELLQAVGIYPQLASDGHEAVALLAKEGPAAYDLVLMDVQMPVLDGQAATRLIRSWSGFAALPIVAMTAHALEHERRNSLAAGMNDHISKPFDHASFYAMLDKWLPWGPAAAPAAAPPGDGAKGLPELRCLDVAAALPRFSGNEQRYRHWLAKFVEESPEMAPQLRRALANGNTDKALAAVRSFKGTAGTLGLEDLEARAAELEQAIRKGRDSVPELRQLERAIDEARREIITSFGL